MYQVAFMPQAWPETPEGASVLSYVRVNLGVGR